MYKFILASLLSLCLQHSAWAQLHGTVINKTNLATLGGATLIFSNGRLTEKTTSLSDGSFTIALDPGNYQVTCSYAGFLSAYLLVSVPLGGNLKIALSPGVVSTKEVLVQATRAGDRSGTTYTVLDSLPKTSVQDLPYLLESVPSVVAGSDGGLGVGYTSLRIRGSDAASTNVTINGIPYNDAESLGTYFVDIPDLASSVESVQVQRGVGSSTNGPGAFGANLNIQTESPAQVPHADLLSSFGSFGTYRTTVKAGTGIFGDGWAATGRYSQIGTDGYVERASARLESYFITLSHQKGNSLFRVNVFSGKEKTYQAYNGVPEDTLPVHRRYNSFTYSNQTDNYRQTHYQAFFTRLAPITLNLAAHFTRGKGYFEEFEQAALLKDYGLSAPPDSVDLVRRQWLDNYFGGLIFSAVKKGSISQYTLGAAISNYKGSHYGEITHTSTGLFPVPYRYYLNDGTKRDANIFLKSQWSLKALTLSAELQFRLAAFQFSGIDENQQDIGSVHKLAFFSPKIGADYSLGLWHLYASCSLASKEPNRDDYVQAASGQLPRPQHLTDLETGFRYRDSTLSFGATLYYMDYRDGLVLTGRLNEIGNAIRTNVPFSYRSGMEVEFRWRALPSLTWSGNVSLSKNKIRDFEEAVYTADFSRSKIIRHKHTDISFSPAVTAYTSAELNFLRRFHLSVTDHYVGSQYLDNTSNEARKVSGYFVAGARLAGSVRLPRRGQVEISLSSGNLLNVKYQTGGTAYPFLRAGSVVENNSYFPQAGRTFLVGLQLSI